MQRSIDEYILPLGRIRHERLYARPRASTLYVLSNVPPYLLGYAILAPERYVQRSIDDYFTPRERRLQYDDHRRAITGRKDLRNEADLSEQIKTEADHASQEKKR